VLLWAWWYQPGPAGRASGDLPALRLGLTAAILPLLAPHAVWYDAGLVGLSVLALAELGLPPAALVALWLLPMLQLLTGRLGCQPLVPVLFLAAVATALRFRARRAEVRRPV